MGEKLAKRTFPSTLTRLVPNPYFADLIKELKGIPERFCINYDKINILYLCEPIREQSLRTFGTNTIEVIRKRAHCGIFSVTFMCSKGRINSVVIRTHPSEPSDKYQWVRQEFNLPIASIERKELLEEVVESNVVVGCERTAMVVGLLAGKETISCIPPGGNACSLPFPEIEHMQVLVRPYKH